MLSLPDQRFLARVSGLLPFAVLMVMAAKGRSAA
jgi:hypothetical protein